MYKEGDYIVLLAGCNGKDTWDSMPINHCYLLKRDSYVNDNGVKGFGVEKDLDGNGNGWSCYNGYGYRYGLKFRYATQNEIDEYKRLGKPFNITKLPQEPQYEIY